MTMSLPRPTHARWGAVLSIAVGVGALITAEFLPISLLTPIAADLHVSEGTAGQAVTVTAAVGFVASLVIAPLSRGLDRRVLLLMLTGMLVASSVLAAEADRLAVLLIARMILGAALGGIWSMSSALAMRLVPAAGIPRALSMIFGGSSIATVVATPLGSYLSGLIGWRGVFLAAAALGVIAFAWQLLALPSMPSQGQQRLSTLVALVRRRRVAGGLSAVVLAFVGTFTLFTYLRPVLQAQTGVSANGLSLFLMVLGIGGFVGTLLAGPLILRSLRATLVAVPLLMAVFALALTVLHPGFAASLVIVGLWGFASGTMPVAWSTWLTQTVPDEVESGGGLLIASIQLAIMIGAGVGGLLFDRIGIQGPLVGSAAILLAAMAAALMNRGPIPHVHSTPAINPL